MHDKEKVQTEQGDNNSGIDNIHSCPPKGGVCDFRIGRCKSFRKHHGGTGLFGSDHHFNRCVIPNRNDAKTNWRENNSPMRSCKRECEDSNANA